MKKTVLSVLSVALLLGLSGPPSARADSPKKMKPVIVVSLAGYDEMIGDIELIGKLSDRPQLANWTEGILKVFTNNQGLAGLDKKRPCGAVLQTDGKRFSGYAFVPVTDGKKLLAAVKPLLLKVEDLPGGGLKIQTWRRTHFVKQNKAGWVIICDKPEGLKLAPADPGKLLAGLTGKYDLAVRINARNVPQKHRDKFLAKMKEGAKRDLKRRPGEDEQHYAVRKIIGKCISKSIIAAAGDLEQVTLGWSLDHSAKKAFLELSLTAAEGTKTAKQFARLGNAKTDFAGFVLPGAALSGSCSFRFRPPETAKLDALIDAIRAGAFKQIEKKDKSAEDTKAARQLVGGLLAVAKETIATGHVDKAMSVVLRPDAVTLVAGRNVANTARLDKTLKQLAEAARKKHPEFVAKVLKLDAGRHKGMRLHTLSLPVPKKCKGRDKVVRLVGEKLEVVVGIGRQHVCVAVGKDAMKTLKRAIDRSKAAGRRTAVPMKFVIDLGQLAEFVAAAGKQKHQEKAKKAVALLGKLSGHDHVSLVASPIRRGVRLRLEFDEGALRLLAKRHSLK